MGRSRGGLTTKIHAIVDADGLPVTLELSAGQLHDSKPALQMLKGVPEGCIILADKAYDSDALRDMAKDKDAWANIPPKGEPEESLFIFEVGIPPTQSG